MRLLLFLLPLLLACGLATTANAQIVQLANESFRKALPQGWSVYPASTPTAPTWASDTNVAASGKYAMHGYVPYNAGDTVELVTPFYDCSNYKHVQLRFKHICKVLGSDMCQIMYRENNLSSRWIPIPSDAYEGESVSYKRTLSFSDLSYSEWKSNDTFAVADNTWWKEETFDLSNCASYSSVAFKFVIRKGTYFGSFIADGWHIDDFEVRAMIDSNHVFRLPEASFVSTFADTVFSQGPFAIQAKLVSRAGMKLVTPWLHYTSLHNDTLYNDSLQMIDVNGGDSLWKTSIPKQPYNTKLVFSTRAYDMLGEAVVTDSFYVKEKNNNIVQSGSVGLVSINKPLKYQQRVQQTVEVTFKNGLNLALTYAELYWSVNGVQQSKVAWVGNVGSGKTGTCQLGTYFPDAVADTIVVWIKNPNYLADSITSDDTLMFVSHTCDFVFSGSCSIGRGNYDFQTLEEALEKMHLCGIGGDVKIKIADGVYEGNLNFSNLRTSYSVLISSMSGHADSVMLVAKSGNALNILSSQNVHFENLTFVADSVANHVVYFSKNCKNFTFKNCIFKGRNDITGSSEDYAVVYLAGEPDVWSGPAYYTYDSIVFIGNRFLYGTYGLLGHRRTLDELYPYHYDYSRAYNMVVENNLIEDFLSGGIGLSNCKTVNIVGNIIRANGNGQDYFGVRLAWSDTAVAVSNNEIILNSLKGSSYGIYSIRNEKDMKVVNNSVAILGNSSSAQYGIRVSSGNGEWATVRNNVVYIDNSIKASSYPLFIGVVRNLAGIVVDDNTWFCSTNVAGASVFVINQYMVEELSTMSFPDRSAFDKFIADKGGSTIFRHDVFACPVFADITNSGLRLREFTNMLCGRYSAVQTDKDGTARSQKTVKGCYASPLDKYNVTVAEILGWPGSSYVSDTLNPKVVILNGGSDVLTSATVTWELDGVRQSPVQWKGSLPFCGTDTLVLGSVKGLTQGNHILKAYLTALSAQDYVKDDTLQKSTKTCVTDFSGSYTVGDTGFFKDLDEAVASLNVCGMSGPVTLRLQPGTYHMNTVIPYLPGISSANSLHITSLTGDSSSVVLRRADSSNTSLMAAPLIVNGAEYVKISRLTLSGMGSNDTVATCGHAVVITGGSSHIEISGCRMVLPQYLRGTGDYDALAGVFRQVQPKQMDVVKDNNCANFSLAYIYNGIGKDLQITDNTMDGGVCAFHVEGTNDNSRMSDVLIGRNVISGVDYGACQAIYVNNCVFSGNRVQQRAHNHSSKGFAVNTGHSKIRVERNVFHYMELGSAIVGHFTTVDVVNNEIKGGNVGIFMGKQGDFNIYHNSIYVNTNAISIIQAVGMNPQQWNQMYRRGNQYCYNNIFHVKNGKSVSDDNPWYGMGWKWNEKGNCYYNDATGTANVGLGITVGATSVSVLPVYKDTSVNLECPNSSALKCDVLEKVPYDIDGRIRNDVTVMGAYDSKGAFYDLSLQGFVGADSLTASVPGAVGVILQNRSFAPIDTASITIYVNKVKRLRMTWRPGTPLVGEGATDTVWLGNVILQQGFNELFAVVRHALDTLPYNDTVRWSSYLCSGALAGNYTVFGNQADFASVEELKLALYTCGISKNVEFRMRPGTYGGLHFDTPVPGSDSNSITFVADSGAVVFDGGTDGTGLVLNNAKNMTFRGLTFGNLKDGKIGVQLRGNCTNVTFRECDICASTTATVADYKAVDYTNSNNSTTYPVNVRFIGNHISGGCYNIYLYYLAGTNAQMYSSSFYIDSNLLTDAYQYGIYTYYYAYIPSISYNHIESRAKNNGVNYFGLYTPNCLTYDIIQGNRIWVKGNVTGYGIWLGTSQNYYVKQNGVVANNVIHVSGEKSQYGIYLDNRYSNFKLHHNSVYVNSYSETAYGFYINFSANAAISHNITRNLVIAYGSRTYPLYFAGADFDAASTAYGAFRQWNNWYAKDTIACIAGYICHNINDLQKITSDNDRNSVSYMPLFKDTSVGLELKKYELFACPILSDVPYDINGSPRSPITAMGAYGFEIHDNVNLEMTEIIAPLTAGNAVCASEYVPVRFSFRSSGVQTANFDSSALKVSLDVTGPVTYHYDTIIRSGMLASGKMDTMTLGRVPVMESGTYSIKVTLKDSADVYLDDDTLSTNYTVNWINPPYDVDFTTVPAELLSVSPSGSIGWKVVQGAGTAPAVAPAFGKGRLEFAGAGNPGASANAVFNAVSLKGCLNPTLSFWYAHDADDSKRDLMFVLATTDGGATYTEIGRITAAAAVTGWQQYDIDLSRFANASCLSIVFQAISFGGANQSLDRIRITADADAALTLLPVDFTAFTACENDAVPLKVVVTNQTALPFAYSSDTVTAEVTGATTQSFSYVYNKQLAGYETDTVTLGNMDLRANGNYYINVSMQSQDDNAQNDTASDSTILIRQDIAMDSIIGIDAQTQHPGGDTVYVSALVRNNCNMAVDRFTVTMELNGETVVTDTVLRHMEAGDSIIHAVSMPYVVPFGTKEQPYYFLELSASIPCDGDANNDSRSVVGVIAVPDTVDLQVLSIAQPATDSGRVKVSPKVTVANVGNAEVRTVMLHVDVLDSGSALLETVSEYINFINADDTLEYSFSLSYTVPNYDGRYYLKAYVDRYADEINTANDTLTSQFVCRRNATGIADHVAAGWSVGQNEPNPASGVTVIPFVIPEDAEVVLTLTNVNGQLLHREIVAATAGANRVTLQVGTLPSGLYYYGVEYKGQRIVRKMNVVR